MIIKKLFFFIWLTNIFFFVNFSYSQNRSYTVRDLYVGSHINNIDFLIFPLGGIIYPEINGYFFCYPGLKLNRNYTRMPFVLSWLYINKMEQLLETLQFHRIIYLTLCQFHLAISETKPPYPI